MIWEFAILDRNNVEHIIDEPVGWDAMRITLKRDAEFHGVFLEVAGQNLQYHGDAKTILKTEFDTHGVAGQCSLIIRQQCAGEKIELERYKFLFISYEYVCGAQCYVVCPVETNSEVANLRNKLTQKVDLETLKTFEGTTLPAYDKLAFDIELPSKAIKLMDKASATKEIATPVLGVVTPTPSSEWGQLELAMDVTTSAEIGSFSINTDARYKEVGAASPPLPIGAFFLPGTGTGVSPTWFYIGTKPLVCSPIINFSEDSPGYNDLSGVINTDVKVKFRITPLNGANINGIAFVIARLPQGLSGENVTDYEWIFIDHLYNNGIGLVAPQTFESNYVNGSFVLNKGDRIYSYITIYNYKGVGADPALPAFEVKHFKDDSYWRMETLTYTPATNSKVFMINEAISRVVEAITDNKLKAYSYYFGRTDSKPYAFAEDGCGSLECITDGLRVRRAERKVDGNKTVFAQSLQDIFDGINPVHNIGMGVEPDENRDGFRRLRIEPWKHFYKDEVILTCNNIDKISRSVDRKNVFSAFQFGYQKWEAEQYTGLDEFLTKRNYRTTLNLLNNTLIKQSKMVASGYASEVTRRKGNLDSKDWRYDKDTFLYCLKRGLFLFSVSVQAVSSTSVVIYAIYGLTFDFLNVFFAVGSRVRLNSGTYDLGTITVATITSFGPNIGVTITFPETIPSFGLFGVFTAQNFNYLGIELGGIASPENMIDPATIYNFRISPLRNAMRWANKLLASYKYFDINSKAVFTDGDGNYFAKGLISDPDCPTERIPIRENDAIDLTIFEDGTDAQPFASPERIRFDYPLSLKELNNLKAKPCGLITYNGCESGSGWVDSLEYKPKEGLATFILIPKIN